MHQSSEILKTLGGVPQECLKQSEMFSVQSNGTLPREGARIIIGVRRILQKRNGAKLKNV